MANDLLRQLAGFSVQHGYALLPCMQIAPYNFHLGLLRPEPFLVGYRKSLLGSSRGRRTYVIRHRRLYSLTPAGWPKCGGAVCSGTQKTRRSLTIKPPPSRRLAKWIKSGAVSSSSNPKLYRQAVATGAAIGRLVQPRR